FLTDLRIKHISNKSPLKQTGVKEVYMQGRGNYGLLTIGANKATPTPNATTVNNNWIFEKPFPNRSNAWLGVTRVPKMSSPYANTRPVLSSSVGLDSIARTPTTSRECVRYHLASKSRK